MPNHLSVRLPRLGAQFEALPLATLPTPVTRHELRLAGVQRAVLIKHDEASGPRYGGNKVRKLEYLLHRARDREAVRVATYGAAGSNHALATALYAHAAGLACTCLLSPQPVQPGIGRKLLAHQLAGTEIVRFGGPRSTRVAIQRRHLQGRGIALLPMGGSNWIGTLGFVNAGLELAAQVADGLVDAPSTVYVAAGTLGTTAGIALGLALAGLDAEVRGIRVTDTRIANPAALRRLLGKTAELMRRADPSVPAGLADRAQVLLRDDFYGAGYGRSDARTESAIAFAAAEFGLALDSTYSGKALAALLHDLAAGSAGRPLFWNTANAIALDVPEDTEPDYARLPADFACYFGTAQGASL